MKQKKNHFLSVYSLLATLLLAAVVLSSCASGVGTSPSAGKSDTEMQLKGALDYLESIMDGAFRAGDSSSDWCVYLFGTAGRDFDYESYLKDMESFVTACYKTDEKISKFKATEWQRICLAIKAAGGDPEHFAADAEGKPINLVADGTYNWTQTDALSSQGSNALCYALIVLEDGNYEVPEGSKYTREGIVDELLKHQDESGAFALGIGEQGSADITAFALQALAPFRKSNKKVEQAVEKALLCLSDLQQDSGLFLDESGYTSETVSQVILALCKLGIDPSEDERFTKAGGTVLDALMQFKMDDGSFAHELPEDTGMKQDNLIASIQAAQALEALIAYEKGNEQ